jgi:HlyD family secretion protein
MDVARHGHTRRHGLRRLGYIVGAVAIAGVASAALVGLRPAAPRVEASTIWHDTVKRGAMVRQVRGLGVLVPERLRYVAAPSAGRVERVLVQPGTAVDADTVILELSNPQLDQELEEAVLRLRAAEATLASLRLQLQTESLQLRAAAAAIEAEYQKARMQADMNQSLAERKLVSELVRRQSQLDADQLDTRRRLADEQEARRAEANTSRLAIEQSAVDQARAIVQLRTRQRDDLRVRAGIEGVLQLVTADVGQQIAPGANLARVADPVRLRAEIKIAETQARDVRPGQPALIDTRNGVIPGQVVRIDPSVQQGTRTVDVRLDGQLPPGAVPDLSVDGTIELERLDDVLYVARPSVGQEHATVSLFRLAPDGGSAVRTSVRFGRGSVNAVEVAEGLAAGDRVILSDMSAWDGVDRLRLD